MIFDPNLDGIEHINVYSKGRTKLGRLLSNFAKTPFECDDGHFMSIEGYWYWLGHQDDRLREKYGFAAKKLGRSLGAPDWQDSEEFKLNIKDALRYKIEQNEDIAEALIDSSLPLVHYYVFKNKIVIPQEGKWVVEELEKIREELKEHGIVL